MTRMRKRFLDCKDLTIEQAASFGTGLAEQQRDGMFQMGDLARFSEAKWPDIHYQVWPDWVSPGLIDRCKAVAKAYPNEEDRQSEATYTQFMQNAGKPDRLARLAAIVDQGLTTDESRKTQPETSKARWLLAIDTNYFLHRFWYSGAGIQAAVEVASWVHRTTDRLKDKGLSDVVCCFDSRINNRKQLTEGWDDKYKDRPPKDPELSQQLNLVRELLEGHGFCCSSQDGFEGDDIMCSLATQFDGKVTILSADKDLRMCLSDKCNILIDVEWTEDETSGEMTPEYKWVTAKSHTEQTGISPDLWAEYQTIMGDTVDGVKGVIGIGAKGASDLIQQFGSVEGAIQAAKDNDESIKPKKREALIEFEAKLDVTRQLVTLRRDLDIPANTKI